MPRLLSQDKKNVLKEHNNEKAFYTWYMESELLNGQISNTDSFHFFED